MLYELVTGELKDWEVAPVFSDLLEGTGIEFVHGSTAAVDHDADIVAHDPVDPVDAGGGALSGGRSASGPARASARIDAAP